ncbi:MAG: hypothetical protein KAX78_12305, partial [Phycisphaerae bacterium]|nr:hypothetical protein [Phycisphaerae bacterium]
LEERLLLTTLSGGEFFIYLNSHDEAVRVSLHGDPTDQIELLAWDNNQGGLVDLVGIPGDMHTDGSTHVRIDDRVRWPDGQDIIEFDVDGNPTGWISFGPGDPDADPPTSEIRGAPTEIWSIYVSTCSADTVLTLSSLDGSAIDWANAPDEWELWNISTWGSTVPFAGQIVPDGPGPVADISAPAGSGGVLVGGERVFDHDPDDPDPSLKFIAVQDDEDQPNSDPFGVFPGGDIHPGIDIADTADDFGRIMAAGTVAGGVTTDYSSIDTLYMGFLYGNVEIGENLGTISMRKGGGAVMEPDAPAPSTDGSDYISPVNGSMITVNGHLTFVESRGGEGAPTGMNGQTLYSAIQVLDDPAIDNPDDTIYELEVATDDYSRWDDNNSQARKLAWVYGFITDDPASAFNYNNDIPQNAQFLSHPTGEFKLIGSRDGDGGW